jgi:hypothetical protein
MSKEWDTVTHRDRREMATTPFCEAGHFRLYRPSHSLLLTPSRSLLTPHFSLLTLGQR